MQNRQIQSLFSEPVYDGAYQASQQQALDIVPRARRRILAPSCGALLLECIVYCHCNPGRTRKALLFCRIVDGINDIGREWYIDDNVQATFETINQPCNLA